MKKECVKKLFITHSVNTFDGASRSLRGLIKNLDEKVDLIAPIDGSVSNQRLKKFFGKNIDKIYRFYLPFRMSLAGGSTTLRKWCETEALYLSNKKQLFDLIKDNEYQFIHLNSYVLYPLLDKNLPMYIHIREIYEGSVICRKIVKQYIQSAKGVIYIDQATKDELRIKCNKDIILNNPFNQEAVLEVDVEAVRKELCLNKETIFLFLAAGAPPITPIKGLEFLIETFIKANCKNSKLLIAGTPTIGQYKKYKKNKNVLFLGKIEHTEKIYAIADYVLRGEPFFAVGRTVYEGLYSGCNVIMPGEIGIDEKKIFEYECFRENIFVYPPRDLIYLANIMKQQDGTKKQKVRGFSNEKQYIESLMKFIE